MKSAADAWSEKTMADDTTGTQTTEARPRITLRGAVFIGIGSMVGAGIFALFGQAGAIAGAAVWLSFFFGGIIEIDPEDQALVRAHEAQGFEFEITPDELALIEDERMDHEAPKLAAVTPLPSFAVLAADPCS